MRRFTVDVMHRIDRWRRLGRPQAALVGVQYIGWNQMHYPGKPYVLRYPKSAAWIFDGTELKSGDTFGYGGIESHRRASSSPPGLQVLATIPDVFGPNMTAEMTDYETTNGAKVFAAGAFSMAESIWAPDVQRVVENLWAHLAEGVRRT